MHWRSILVEGRSAGLGIDETEVDAFLGHEDVVVAELQDFPFTDNGDFMRVTNRWKPMGDRDRRSSDLWVGRGDVVKEEDEEEEEQEEREEQDIKKEKKKKRRGRRGKKKRKKGEGEK